MSDNRRNWWSGALEIFVKVSSWIAIPVLLALFVGKYLDTRWGSEPWMFLGLTAVAFVISIFGIIKETMKYYRKIEKEHDQR